MCQSRRGHERTGRTRSSGGSSWEDWVRVNGCASSFDVVGDSIVCHLRDVELRCRGTALVDSN
jgi:hypothetical protein